MGPDVPVGDHLGVEELEDDANVVVAPKVAMLMLLLKQEADGTVLKPLLLRV